MGDNYSYIQSQRIQKEKQYWTKLRQLSDNDNVKEFYQLYMEYLEWSNILSNDRKAIYKMAKKIAENN
jgi:hypothetical protein